MRRPYLLPVLLLGCLIVGSANGHAKSFSGLGLGVKSGLLFGCLSSAGVTASKSLGNKFHWESSLLFSQSDKTSSIRNSDQTGINDIEKEEYADVEIIKASVKRQMAHTQLRFFPGGGSFNLALGYGVSQLQASFKAESLSTDAYIDEDYTVYYGAASFSVGNLWTFRNFFVGMDWLGTMVSTFENRAHDDRSSANTTVALDEYKDSFRQSALFCSKNGGGILLVFSGGILL